MYNLGKGLEQNMSLEELTDEIIIKIVSYLDAKDIASLEITNKSFNQKLSNHILEIWKWRCIEKWDELALATSIEPNEWKTTYIRKLKENTNIDSLMDSFGNCDWYSCPNGHLYMIGECRLPMAIGRCPTCKTPIGGRSHRMIENNARLGRVKRDNLKNKGLTIDQLSAAILQNTNDNEWDARNRRITPTMRINEVGEVNNEPHMTKRERKAARRQQMQNQQNQQNQQRNPQGKKDNSTFMETEENN